jgi:hypothetical protein
MADGNGRLISGIGVQAPIAQTLTIVAITIPLGKATAGGGT